MSRSVIAIIQARMRSTRLPGKVLADLEGDTVLARVIARVRRCELINDVVVATSSDSADDPIVVECSRLSARVFRGSENDVLDRYFRAAQNVGAEIVVRITSDCPLIDPEVSDLTVRAFLANAPDYASNILDRTYPRGLDTEVMSYAALESAWLEAADPYEREHVTPYLYRHPERFKLLSLKGDRNYSRFRWTLDTPEDLAFLRAIYRREADAVAVCWQDVINLLESEPGLIEINRNVTQKA